MSHPKLGLFTTREELQVKRSKCRKCWISAEIVTVLTAKDRPHGYEPSHTAEHSELTPHQHPPPVTEEV